MTEISNGREGSEERRYCSRCGRSLVPLPTIHVSRPCNTCGETVYLAESGKGGKGIKIQKGDKVTLPAGSIKLSLDPKMGGKFNRAALYSFIDSLLVAGRPKSADELEGALEYYEKEGLNALRSSPLLDGLDIDSEEDADEIWERLSWEETPRELAAALVVSFVDDAKDAIAANDTRRAAWAMQNATIFFAVYVTKEQNFQAILWEGYEAHRFLSQVNDAAAETPAEAKAIEKLRSLFEDQAEAVLHTWVSDGRPIGPRINAAEVPEDTLRALAEYYLRQHERRRKEEERQREERRKKLELFIKFLSASVGLGIGIITALEGLKALGII